MVDVGAKTSTKRTATARGRIFIPKVAYDLIMDVPSIPRRPVAAASSSPMTEQAKAKSRGKGDVLTVAQLAAIMGCKRTSELIPLCHPLQLSHVAVELRPEVHLEAPPSGAETDFSAGETPGSGGNSQPGGGDEESRIDLQPPRVVDNLNSKSETLPSGYSILCLATVKCDGKTGVEMEALTAVSVGLLTVWDMLKAVAGKEMVIGEIFVSDKSGGSSGDFQRTSC